MEQYHRATAEQFITDLFVEQQNRYNSYHSYNVQQQSRYNSYNLERYHSKTAITAEHLEQLSQQSRYNSATEQQDNSSTAITD